MLLRKGVKRLIFSLLLVFIVSLPASKPASGNPYTPIEQAGHSPDEESISPSALGYAWFVTEGGTGTDCTRTNPGPLQYCVETKAQSGDTVYVGDGIYDTDDFDDNLLFIQKSIRLVGSCTWNITGPIICKSQNTFTPTVSSRLNGENQRRVIAVQGPGISVTIENFVIYQGSAEGKDPAPYGSGYGGGIYAANIDQLIIKNNYIWQNKANVSDSGYTYGYGGGIYAANIQNLEILENIIIFNSASAPTVTGYGGGLYVELCGENGIVSIVFNRLHENFVGDSGTYSRAAGASLQNVENLQLDGNVFEYHNHTIRHYWIPATALDLYNVTANSLDRNSFRKNYGSSLVEFTNLMGDFSRNKFWDNESAYDLRIYHGEVINLINNFFGKLYPDTTTSEEADVKLRGGISTLVYIGAACGNPRVNIIHNTFALAEYGVQMEGTMEVDILRNIFTAHSKKAIDIFDPLISNVDVTENLFYSNYDNGETGTTYWVGNPLLADLFSGDFHILPGSAAIDMVSGGMITTDIDGQPRPIGLGIDLGADEYGITIHLPLIIR